MRDEEIRSCLQEQMASVHVPTSVYYRTLQAINEKDEIIVKKKITCTPVIAVLMILAMLGTAVAAGFLWGHPLEQEMEISDDTKQLH